MTGGFEPGIRKGKGKEKEKEKERTADKESAVEEATSISAGKTKRTVPLADESTNFPLPLVSEIKKKTLSQHKVRISLQDRTLDSMFPVASPAQIHDVDDPGTGADPPPNAAKSREIKESECYLSSVRDLRDSLTKNKHNREHSILCLNVPITAY